MFSGESLRRGSPKALRRICAAGSVYYP
ncbi:hypothetical protein JC607_05815 [Paracoccus sp. IB05]|nr:hypothetical protein [Paracoccus sp. IB05]